MYKEKYLNIGQSKAYSRFDTHLKAHTSVSKSRPIFKYGYFEQFSGESCRVSFLTSALRLPIF